MIGFEHVTSVCPLGVRFWDAVTDSAVGGGLNVSVTPVGGGRVTLAAPPHAEIYAAFGLPGIEAQERGDGTSVYWAAPPATANFRVDVVDPGRRFLPAAFELALPHRGVYTGPDPTGRGVPLFSSPERPVPGGKAVLRADLWDVRAGGPAAWGVLEVLLGGTLLGRGLAGPGGQVAAILPWPALPANLAPPPALLAQAWPIDVRLRYERIGGPDGPPLLGAVLGQALAVLLDAESPEQPFATPPLEYGTEQVLASATSTEHRLLCRPKP
jgi:hypothetical protein